MIPLLVLGGLASLTLIAAAVQSRLPKTIGEMAVYWADRRRLPISWVLATIDVENPKRNPRAITKTEREHSIGLMQVNVNAQTRRLSKHGLTADDLLDPFTNIMIGTEILAEVTAAVRKAYEDVGQVSPPSRWDRVVRQAYRGPNPILAAIRAGKDPLAVYADTPQSLARWEAAMARYAVT